jgi:hypothetical protein
MIRPVDRSKLARASEHLDVKVLNIGFLEVFNFIRTFISTIRLRENVVNIAGVMVSQTPHIFG